ncbi:MAG: anaerobic ribonucleoside-triphosphate reductase activating protein [Candidatus Aenigmarchaeota archaeon]|nr:anaerobic ribonucleoside-triphosphate reductase activating protein [Candidatus Aenigmarchaeota archaeon]
MQIKGFQKTSLIDYPGNICSIIFLSGCNFRCNYCYNPELVLDEKLPEIKEKEVLKTLEERKKFIDGVTITGGEPTIHKELPILIKKIKKIGLLIKIDTNGTNPEMLNYLIKNKLIDFIAMDIKNVFEKYKETANVNVNINKIKESVKIIKESGIEHEFRTTVLPRLHIQEDIIKIAKELKDAKKYVLQQFFPAEKMLDKNFIKEKTYSEKELEGIRAECNRHIKTEIRNI